MWELVDFRDFRGCSAVLILCRYSSISGEAIGVHPGAPFLEWISGWLLPKEVF